MRVRSRLGRSTTPLALWLTVGSSLAACGGRDAVIGGPFGGEDDATTGGSSHRGGSGGRAAGGSGGGAAGTAGGASARGGSSAGGSFSVGGSEVDDGGGANFPGGGEAGFGASAGVGVAGGSGFATAGFGGSFGGASAGDAGMSAGGFSPGGSASGGFGTAGSSMAGFGAGGAAGSGVGGAAGFGAGGSGTAGSATAGSGTGGSSGGSGGAVGHLGDECPTNGALACHGSAQRLKLLCDGNVWRTNGTCVESENCDTRSGVCASIVPECVDKLPTQRFCRTNTLAQCGPDLVTYDWLEDCTGRCVETASSADCAPERCGDGRVQAGETCDDGNTVDTDTCTNHCTKAVCGDGSLYTALEKCDDGNGVAGDSCSVVCGSDAVMVGAGYYHSCALGMSGGIQCWGYNSSGQLGTGDTQTRGSWIMDMGVNLPVVKLGSGKSAVAFSGGYQSNCAILNDGSLKCWGYNYYGQLGVGDTASRGSAANHLGDNLPAVDLGSARHAVRVSAGSLHTCAVLDDGTAKCWGYNYYGQLGQGDTQTRGDVAGELGDNLAPINLGTGLTVQAIAAGGSHTCALFTSGQMKCWGYSYYGQAGQGDAVTRGDNAGEMGDNLPFVDLGSGRSAQAIALGESHTCALLDDGSVKCWGNAGYGQLGQGDALYRGDSPGELGDALLPVDLGTGHSAKAVSAGTYNTCVILENDQIKCWGYNGYGALGIGDTNTHGDGPNEMGNYLPTVSLGTGRSAKSISVGSTHVCALLDNATVKCWGNNSYSQLGLGTGASTGVGDGAGELGDNLPYVVVTF